jgi:hypothetical protein
MACMFSKSGFAQPEGTTTSNQHTLPASGNKKPTKKLYALVAGIITIAIIAVALFIPQGVGNSIQLSLNYTIGEKMVYNTTNTITNQMNSTSIDMATNPTSANTIRHPPTKFSALRAKPARSM